MYEDKKEVVLSLIKSHYGSKSSNWYLLYEPVDCFLYLYQDLPKNHRQNTYPPYKSIVMDISLGERVSDIIGDFLMNTIQHTIVLRKYKTKDRHQDIFKRIREILNEIKKIHSLQRNYKYGNNELDKLNSKDMSLNQELGNLLNKIIEFETKLCLNF